VDEDAFNLSLRKFLKQVGITAQRDIELGVRELLDEGRLEGDERLGARATVVVEGLEHEIVIESEIALSAPNQPS
jgi:uncharacterized protein DUF6494